MTGRYSVEYAAWRKAYAVRDSLTGRYAAAHVGGAMYVSDFRYAAEHFAAHLNRRAQ